MQRKTLKRAAKLKREWLAFVGEDNVRRWYPLNSGDAFSNPIAISVLAMQYGGFFSKKSRELLNECYSSSKLIIQQDHLVILREFFESRRSGSDVLSVLYQDMTFDEFLLRLFHKRYQEVYLDGRAVVGRAEHPDFFIHNVVAGKKFLYGVGGTKDTSGFYKEYLTLEETMLSSLVLPQTMSVVIGTGNRSKKWDVAGEFVDSIDAAIYSYPAAAEFRNGHTTHYDLLFMTIPHHGYTKAQVAQIQHIIQHPALLVAAKSIYGTVNALSEDDLNKHRDAYVYLEVKSPSAFDFKREGYYLHKQAYLHRTKHVLRQVLLSADYEMEKYQLGKTFQLKGLGLGAFAFNTPQASEILESLYLQALKEVITETSLHYIDRINVINLPTTFGLLNGVVFEEFNINGVRVISSDMNPTEKHDNPDIGLVGGTVFCGDSGSQVGNEGNVGTHRASSDDPATQYSILNPKILDPDYNKGLQDAGCLYVMTGDRELVKLADWRSRCQPTLA